MPVWTWLAPALSLALLVVAGIVGVDSFVAALCGIGLIGAVIAGVHHAEVVAHRVGEPFGTLVLAVAVTVIEASLILSMMLAGGDEMATLPRDTIYATVMLICTGVVGLCVLVGGLAHHEQSFRVEGAGSGLAALIVMSTLTLVLPDFTTSTAAGTYSSSQLVFVALTSAALWAIFIFIQTVRHRDYFIPVTDPANPEVHGRRLGCSGGQDVDPGVLADFPAAAVLEASQRGVGHQEKDGRERQCAGLQSVGDRAGGIVADDLAPNEERSVAGLDSEGVVVVLPEDVREDEDAPRRRCQLPGLGRCLVEASERCLYFAVQALRTGRHGRSRARQDRREDGQNENVPGVGLSHRADACGSIAPNPARATRAGQTGVSWWPSCAR